MAQQGTVIFTFNGDIYNIQYIRTESGNGLNAEPEIEMISASKGKEEKELDLETLTDNEYIILEALTRDLVMEKEKGGEE